MLVEGSVELIRRLIDQFPQLDEMYSSHLFNERGQVLPHIFFADLTEEIIDSYTGNSEDMQVGTGGSCSGLAQYGPISGRAI